MPRDARAGNPIHHFILWLVCVLGVIFLHVPFLHLPYYWDEAGYYFPAALDLAQHGHLIPRNTMANPHPPLLSIYLATWYKVFGTAPVVTRVAMCTVAGTALYTLLLLATLLVPASPGLWAASLLALSPLFFAESSLAQLDVAATAATLLALYFFLRGRLTAYLIAATILCLTRETGAVIVILLAVLARQPVMLTPLVPLCGWFAILRLATGNWLGDAGFVTYNIWTVLNPLRMAATFLRRLFFLFVTDFRWMLAVPALHALWKSRRELVKTTRPGYQLLWLVIAAQLLVMSVFGGAVLDRYILPALALFYLLAMESIVRLRLPHHRWSLLALLILQIGCFFWNPPYPFPFEENLAYVDFINLQEAATDRLQYFPEGVRVLTTWPATDEFRRPELGYVKTPVNIVPLEDFSEASFENVQASDFDVVLMFSNEWQPSWNLLEEVPLLNQIRTHLYHRHAQMSAQWVSERYGLMSLGKIHLRGQSIEWLTRPTWQRPLRLPHTPSLPVPGKTTSFVLP